MSVYVFLSVRVHIRIACCFVLYKKKGAGRWVRRFTATEAGACELAVKNGTEKDWPPTYNSQVKYVAPKMIRVPVRTDLLAPEVTGVALVFNLCLSLALSFSRSLALSLPRFVILSRSLEPFCPDPLSGGKLQRRASLLQGYAGGS